MTLRKFVLVALAVALAVTMTLPLWVWLTGFGQLLFVRWLAVVAVLAVALWFARTGRGL